MSKPKDKRKQFEGHWSNRDISLWDYDDVMVVEKMVWDALWKALFPFLEI